MDDTKALSLTPTQQRIYDILSDWKSHSKNELFTCLNDELTSMETLRIHIVMLRKRIKEVGEGVVCEVGAGIAKYRKIRLTAE